MTNENNCCLYGLCLAAYLISGVLPSLQVAVGRIGWFVPHTNTNITLVLAARCLVHGVPYPPFLPVLVDLQIRIEQRQRDTQSLDPQIVRGDEGGFVPRLRFAQEKLSRTPPLQEHQTAIFHNRNEKFGREHSMVSALLLALHRRFINHHAGRNS